MITISPIKLTTVKNVSFNNNNRTHAESSKVGLVALDKNSNNKVNFEKDLFITQNADSVQTNPIKALGYNFVKAYNILSTPNRNYEKTESRYIHLPFMA